MKTIEAGSTILEVHALTAPKAIGTGKLVHIADLVLITPLVTSKWGDEHLHFRHRNVQSDVKFWPKTWGRKACGDVTFVRNADTTWGRKVPQGVWPETDEKAEDFYIEQV